MNLQFDIWNQASSWENDNRMPINKRPVVEYFHHNTKSLSLARPSLKKILFITVKSRLWSVAQKIKLKIKLTGGIWSIYGTCSVELWSNSLGQRQRLYLRTSLGSLSKRQNKWFWLKNPPKKQSPHLTDEHQRFVPTMTKLWCSNTNTGCLKSMSP